MSTWIRKRRRDQYYRKAKEDGYPSRAAYKLLELNRRYGLIKKGDKVLDIGSAPGGWSQVARDLVGTKGLVVGVDLEETQPPDHGNVVFLIGDIMDDHIVEEVGSLASEFDAVVSDASPTISGVWARDHLLSVDLARRALQLCDGLLRVGGNFVAKVFQGEELDRFHMDVKQHFSFARRAKPRASRAESSEVYLVGKGFIEA